MFSFLKRLDLGSERYPALTGVRAAGASVVFLDHFPPWPGQHIVVNVMAFFFALSGFLIVRIYYEQAQLSRLWLAKYFVNRFARIYPVYFLLLTVAVLLGHEFHPWVLFTNYTLTHALFHGTTVVIQPSWSLTVEECFYFLAPLFMLLARRFGFLAPFALAAALAWLALLISRLGVAFLGTPAFVIRMTFFGHFVEFFAGVWLALEVLKLEKRGVLQARGAWRTYAGVALVTVLVLAMVFVYRDPALRHHDALLVAINNLLLPVPIALLYAGLIRERSLLADLFGSRLGGLLGRSSYSFYLLHTLAIDYVSIPFLSHTTHRLWWISVTFILAWLAAILLFASFEEPVNLYLRRRFRSKEQWVGMRATLFQVRS